jgi:DNA-directed RNA polymerase subunit RPC12/RpoP
MSSTVPSKIFLLLKDVLIVGGKNAFSNNLLFSSCLSFFCRDPINGVKELKAQPAKNPTPVQQSKKKTPDLKTLKPENAAFWAEGLGKGGDKPWKFRCLCGEVCSSYENYRYHPVGRMYECSRCSIWSHVDCVLGPQMTDEDIDEIVDLLCTHCNSKISRLKRYHGDDYQQYDDRSDIYQLTEKDLVYARDNTGSRKEITPLEKAVKLEKVQEKVLEKHMKVVEKSAPSKSTSHSVKTDMPPPTAPMKKKFPKASPMGEKKKASSSSSSSSATKSGHRSAGKKRKIDESSSDEDTDEDAADGEWRFKCLCGEVCSWYENPLYRPSGRKYQCTNCSIWSHVNCMFGDKITDKDLHNMKVRKYTIVSFLQLG